MAPKIVDREEKKGEILKAAMKVFAQRGVVKTKMVDIATASGIGKGTIYEYFRSKEDIFAEAFQLIFQGTEEKLGEILQEDLEPEEKLKLILTVSLEEFLGDNGEFAGIMMAFWSEGVRNKDERINEIIDLKEIYAQYRALIAEILEEGIGKGQFRKVDPFLYSSALIGAMDGILLQCIITPGIFSPDDGIHALLDSFLNGIKH